MDNISEITTISEDGQNLLLSQFRSTTGNLPAFLGVFLSQVQILETVITPGIEYLYLANATGWALDQIGDRVGWPRPAYGASATSDSAYRIEIYAQIAENESYGTVPDLYNILRSLQLLSVRIGPIYPATLDVQYRNDSATLTGANIRTILERSSHPIAFDITEHSLIPFVFDGDGDGYGFDAGELGEGF